MDKKRSEVRDRLFALRNIAAASPTGSITTSIEILNEVDYAAKKLEQQNASLQQKVETLGDGLRCIVQWSEAYPLDVFPEPDLKKAHAVLVAAGMTLDAISASNMRHVVEGVGQIAREALAATQDNAGEQGG